MRALVVYESMFGNTQAIAEAIADGLGTGMEVDVMEVGTAPTALTDDIRLLVIGGPTHAFGLTRPTTRRDAVDRSGRGVVSAGIGLREWLDGIHDVPPGTAAAAFDTRVDKRWAGSAARAANKRLRRLGFRLAAPPQSFSVADVTGPLVAGEQLRARRWAEQLATGTVERQTSVGR